MGKILSKSGESLADVYDVKGSIAGIENLESDEVHLVHEMGSTILSERLGGSIISITPGAIAQSTNFDIGVSLGPSPMRLLGMSIMVEEAARMTRIIATIRDVPPTINEVPVFLWTAGDLESSQEVVLNGTLTAVFVMGSALPNATPSLLIGTDSRDPVPVINVRGRTSAFGAGTVTTHINIYTAAPVLGGVSSRGLPLPSW